MRKKLFLGVTFVLVLCGLGLAYSAGIKKKAVTPKDFPTGRPFSAGILVGDTLYVSGSTGADLKTGKVPEKFEDEVQLCFDNIHEILKAGGMDFSDAVSVQVYLTDMTLFPRMNAVYIKNFPEPRPTRTTVGVTALAGGAHMEVTVTARK
ncbi:MAG TPA: RidA family protein [Bryobacteraceae bacterium]|nr:RidA family protein [Bryobacteraceae bacterium]